MLVAAFVEVFVGLGDEVKLFAEEFNFWSFGRRDRGLGKVEEGSWIEEGEPVHRMLCKSFGIITLKLYNADGGGC